MRSGTNKRAQHQQQHRPRRHSHKWKLKHNGNGHQHIRGVTLGRGLAVESGRTDIFWLIILILSPNFGALLDVLFSRVVEYRADPLNEAKPL